MPGLVLEDATTNVGERGQNINRSELNAFYFGGWVGGREQGTENARLCRDEA